MAKDQKNGRAGDFDYSQLFDFERLMGQFKLPSFDTSAMVEIQRRNIEALANANRLAFEGIQAIARRQGEILRDAMHEAGTLAREIADNSSPEERLARQTELLKNSFAQTVANIRELSEMGSKSSNEAFEVLSERIASSLDELRQQIEKLSQAGTYRHNHD